MSGVELPVPLLVRMAREIEMVKLFKIECPQAAAKLRALIAEQGTVANLPDSRGSLRGLARLLRRNPTDAERALWHALSRDRRFAGQFKRQTPVGRHIPDFVSFIHRLAIELVGTDESEGVVADRAQRLAWLESRDYRVTEVKGADVEGDLEAELKRLQALIAERR